MKMQYPVTGELSSRSVRCGVRFMYIVKREDAPSTKGYVTAYQDQNPQVYESTMKTCSYSANKKEDRTLLRWLVTVMKQLK